jgi:hypothetical protein
MALLKLGLRTLSFKAEITGKKHAEVERSHKKLQFPAWSWEETLFFFICHTQKIAFLH